jgi:hypothetical protein
MSIESVVDRVQKLLALSKSSNANEAANAAGLANKLIDTYRLSVADLEVQGEVIEPIEEDGGYIYETGKLTPWKHQLMHRLISHYGLAHFNDNIYPGGRKVSRFKVIGRKSDITVAKYMFVWLTTECQRLANVEAKGMGRIYVSSYCEGFVSGVSEQLKASRSEVQRDASSEAIVLVNARSEEAKSFMNSLHNLIHDKTVSQRRVNYGASAQGQKQGQSLHLGQSLGNSAPKLLK